VRGRVIDIAGRRCIIVVVIPADFWQLPGRVDAWLLGDEALTALPGPFKGFVLGRLVPTRRDIGARGFRRRVMEGITIASIAARCAAIRCTHCRPWS